jgi:hypothetical protein
VLNSAVDPKLPVFVMDPDPTFKDFGSGFVSDSK